MGLLSEGSPLDWPETKAKADHVRKHGIKQFINLYHKLQDRTKDVLYWGDEVRMGGQKGPRQLCDDIQLGMTSLLGMSCS